MTSGVETGRFGVLLSQYLHESCGGSGRQIFYDHGDKALDANVAAIQGFWGDKPCRMNRLTDIDVAIVDGQGKVEILIEIEETSFSPKKIIGDVFTVAMCNRVGVKQPHKTAIFDVAPSTVLFVAGIVNPKGHKQAQVDAVLLPRLHQFEGPDGTFRLANTRFVLGDTIEDVISKLKRQVLSELSCEDTGE